MRQNTWRAGTISLLFSALGCSPDVTNLRSEPPQVEVSVQPTDAVLPIGEGLQLKLIMAGVDATPLGGTSVDIQWTSSDDAVATVSGYGLVRARGLGTATITALVNAPCGNHTVFVGVRVTPAVGSGSSGPVAGGAQ